jgi:hypothetical protein
VGVHLPDVDVLGDAIRQGTGKQLGAEDLGPFVEGLFIGDPCRRSFVSLADDLPGAGLRQSQQIVREAAISIAQLRASLSCS